MTPDSPLWGTIVCDYCNRAPVSRQGDVCWNCASYEEYLMAPRCDCPHDPNLACECDSECEEDCPAEEYAIRVGESVTWADGTEPGQGR